MGVIRWLERFGTDGRVEAAMESAARAFSDTRRCASAII